MWAPLLPPRAMPLPQDPGGGRSPTPAVFLGPQTLPAWKQAATARRPSRRWGRRIAEARAQQQEQPQAQTAGKEQPHSGVGAAAALASGGAEAVAGAGGVGSPTVPQGSSAGAGPTAKHRSLRVAYMGVAGAYGEVAAAQAYPGCTPVPCRQFADAFQAVEGWVCERSVVPIENSLGGSIHSNYDLLLRHRLHIVGELNLPVHHCLLAPPGATLSQLNRVLSHPQALAQCEGTLSSLGIRTREATNSTASAAQAVAEGQEAGVAAVASARAGEIYGLEVLREGVQDYSDNVTRFLLLARDALVPQAAHLQTMPCKTSIVFSLHQGPGALFKALSVFALRDIDLSKVESRPHRNKPLLQQAPTGRTASQGQEPPLACDLDPRSVLPSSECSAGTAWDGASPAVGAETASRALARECQAGVFDYLFHVDLQASLAQPHVQNALRHLKELSTFLRVLGSYPRDMRNLNL